MQMQEKRVLSNLLAIAPVSITAIPKKSSTNLILFHFLSISSIVPVGPTGVPQYGQAEVPSQIYFPHSLQFLTDIISTLLSS